MDRSYLVLIQPQVHDSAVETSVKTETDKNTAQKHMDSISLITLTC